ncbi:unnamed protein product [Diatraea saccharalis]|uniref:XK-related protein n=1 Tax=Diatraea saccharalis TaxID=40085 RepID=A0A9N9R8Q3_9NEOP|nr:unnamed protein product [Diatraea saccharalis]
MCVENWVLVMAWWWGGRAARPAPLAAAAAAAFLAGIAFMLLYYRYFHVRRLGYMLSTDKQGTNSTNASLQNKNGTSFKRIRPQTPRLERNRDRSTLQFCRFVLLIEYTSARASPYRRTTPLYRVCLTVDLQTQSAIVQPTVVRRRSRRRSCRRPPPPRPPPPPPPRPPPPPSGAARCPPRTTTTSGGSSENEGSSVGSRVNIQQKLQEKKQKQLAELRVIEEEIKQGKLANTAPVAVEEIYTSLQRQPIPRSKTHAGVGAARALLLPHHYQNYPHPHRHPHPHPHPHPALDIDDPTLRTSNVYDDARTFYENPAAARGDALAAPMRSPAPAYGHMGQYLRYCDARYKFDVKEEYTSPLHVPLNVHATDDNRYGCGQYEQYAGAGSGSGAGAGAGRKEQCRKLQRCRTPEILLAPHYLQPCTRQVCCHWGPAYTNRNKEEGGAASSGDESSPEGGARETPRPPSDIDSQKLHKGPSDCQPLYDRVSAYRSHLKWMTIRQRRNISASFVHVAARVQVLEAEAATEGRARAQQQQQRRERHCQTGKHSRRICTVSNDVYYGSAGDVDSAGNESDRRSNCSASSQLQSPTSHMSVAYDGYSYHPDAMHELYACDRRRRPNRKLAHKPETKL